MEQKKKETLGTVMAVCGGICWGFSGCCGQFLFETRGAKAPWLVALRLLFAGIIMILMGFALHGKRNLDVLKKKADLLRLLIFAFCGISLCQFTYFMAIEASNAGTPTAVSVPHSDPVCSLHKGKTPSGGTGTGSYRSFPSGNLCPWDSWQYTYLLYYGKRSFLGACSRCQRGTLQYASRKPDPAL